MSSPSLPLMRSAPAHPYNLFLTLMLLVSMAVTAFSHNYEDTRISPELAAYLAAGGSLSDLCHGSHDDDAHHGTMTCESCRLVGAAVLPVVAYGVPATLCQATSRMAFVAKRLLFSQQPDPARLSRAPPQV